MVEHSGASRAASSSTSEPGGNKNPSEKNFNHGSNCRRHLLDSDRGHSGEDWPQ